LIKTVLLEITYSHEMSHYPFGFIYSLKHAGQNLAISLQEFIMLSFLYRKKTIKRILFAFLFQTSALPVQSRLVSF